MAKLLNIIIQMRRGTAARWTFVDPVLAAGQPGFENDTYKLKIGDGITKWSLLPYVAGGGGGAEGPQGDSGPAGEPGGDGSIGPPGNDGSPGPAGVGTQGPQGSPGPPGEDGQNGPPGPPGNDGAPGVAGAAGPVGPAGPPGVDGADGVPGDPGAAGPAGATGAPGAAGPPGTNGQDGAEGQEGQAGPPGPQGATGIPHKIQDEGVDLFNRAIINFVGAGVTVTDDGSTTTIVTIPSGGSAAPPAFVNQNLGSQAAQSGSFTFTIASSAVGSLIEMFETAETLASGETADRLECDSIRATGIATAATTGTAYWNAMPGYAAGTKRFAYRVTAI